MTKGLLHSPFVATELFYVTPRRLHLLRANEDPQSAPPAGLPVYMNL